jgi:hypothetical protein
MPPPQRKCALCRSGPLDVVAFRYEKHQCSGPVQQRRGSCTGGRRITVMELPFLLEFPIAKSIRRPMGSEAG